MTSRERLQATLNHQQPDRVCVDFGATFVTGIHCSFVDKLRKAVLGDDGYKVKVNEPYQMGLQDGVLYFEAHPPLEDDPRMPEERLEQLLEEQRDAAGQALNPHLKEHVRLLAAEPRGLAVSIAMYDGNEPLDRARVVQNTVEEDPNAPTLTEVREMMQEIEEEVAAEEEAL